MGITSPASAAGLVERIRAGDRDAEAALVRRYGERLAFLLRRWTRDPETAQDLYQDTFRVALEKIRAGEVREPEKLSGFLRSLAKNLSTYHYRLGDRRQARHVDPEQTGELPAAEPGLLNRLLVKEKVHLVRRVLEELPTARDREILSRFYIAEEDKERICSDLGLATDHFKRVLFRARQRYKALFEGRLQEMGG